MACPADARLLWMSGLETLDTDTSTAADSYEVTESGTDTSVYLASTNVHNELNGGHSSSENAYEMSGTAAAYIIITPRYSGNFANSTISSTGQFHFTTNPSSGCRTIHANYEGGQQRCNVQVCSDDTLKLRNDTTDIGSTSDTMYTRACDANVDLGCDGGAGQCPSGDSCASSCNTTTGDGCWWPGIELTQTSQECELRVNGRKAVDSGVISGATFGQVTEIRMGLVDSGTTATLRVDDIVVDDGSRSGHGWVATGHPDVTTFGGCNAPSCDTSDHVTCVDDWDAGGAYAGTGLADTLRCRNEGESTEYEIATIDPGTETVTGVEAVLVGKYTSTGAYVVGLTIGACDGTDCSFHDQEDTNNSSADTHQELAGHVEETSPLTSPQWGAAALTTPMVRITYVTEPSAGEAGRFGGLLMYARGEKPDAPLPTNLVDRNSDGEITICSSGNSLNNGSITLQCTEDPDETVCSGIEFSCSWAPFFDIPCGTDAGCQTCVNRREEANGGAGYRCTADADCPVSGATCDGTELVCNDNANIPCTVATEATDCNGLGGDCETTATCDDVCPVAGSTCPNPAGWGAFIGDNVFADNVIQYGQGGEGALGGATNYIGRVNGSSVLGYAVKGDGGTCSVAATSCLQTADCPDGEYCDMPDCDYVVIFEGANDFCPQWIDGDLAGLLRFRPSPLDTSGFFGQLATATYCVDDSECSGISSESRCAGASTTDPDDWVCLHSDTKVVDRAARKARGQCTVSDGTEAKFCNENTDCTSSYCWGKGQGEAGGYTTTPGRCGCTNDTHCEAGRTCVDNLCRLDCTGDGDCPGDRVCRNSVCEGRCTVPCSFAGACSASVPCPVFTSTMQGVTARFQGECVSGVCRFCGTQLNAAINPVSDWAYYNNCGHWRGSTRMTEAFAIIQDKASAMGATAPLNIFTTQPRETSTGSWGHADGYLGRSSTKLLNDSDTFPHVVDLRRLQSRDMRAWLRFVPTDLASGYYSDAGIHRTPLGGELLGADYISEYLASLNACAVVERGVTVPQRYCRSVAEVYTSTTCDDEDDCSGTDLCVIKACTVEGDCPDGGDTCNLE